MTELERSLGTADAVMLGLGSMVGAGVFAALAPAAAAAGNGLLIGLDLDHEADQGVGQLLDRHRGRPGVDPGERLADDPLVAADQRLGQRLLAREEVVERADQGAGPRRDFSHRRRLITLLGDHRGRRLHQCGDALLARPPPWLHGAALRAHRTQVTVGGRYFALSNNIGLEVLGTEYYTLLAGDGGRTTADGRETDLFAAVGS